MLLHLILETSSITSYIAVRISPYKSGQTFTDALNKISGDRYRLVVGFHKLQPAPIQPRPCLENYLLLQSVQQRISSQIQSRAGVIASSLTMIAYVFHLFHSMRLVERALEEHSYCVDVYFLLFSWLLGKPVMDLPLHPRLDYVGLFSTFTVLALLSCI